MHELRKTCAGSYEYGIVSILFHEFLDGSCPTNQHIALELYAHLLKLLKLSVDKMLRESEFRNSIAEHPAHLVQSLEYSDAMAMATNISSTCNRCRTGTYNSDLLSRFRSDLREHCTLSFPVRNESFKSSYSYSFVDILLHLPDSTVHLALALLRTYTTADRWKKT